MAVDGAPTVSGLKLRELGILIIWTNLFNLRFGGADRVLCHCERRFHCACVAQGAVWHRGSITSCICCDAFGIWIGLSVWTISLDGRLWEPCAVPTVGTESLTVKVKSFRKRE